MNKQKKGVKNPQTKEKDVLTVDFDKVTNEVKGQLTVIEEISEAIKNFVELSFEEMADLNEEDLNVYFETEQLHVNYMKELDKANGTGSFQRYTDKFDFIVMHIYNTKFVGLTVEEMYNLGKLYVDKQGTQTGYSLGQICTQWNVKDRIEQRGFTMLTDPRSLKGMQNSKRPVINCKIIARKGTPHPDSFLAKNSKKCNNRIAIVKGREEVKAYLLSRGVIEIEGSDILDANLKEVTSVNL